MEQTRMMYRNAVPWWWWWWWIHSTTFLIIYIFPVLSCPRCLSDDEYSGHTKTDEEGYKAKPVKDSKRSFVASLRAATATCDTSRCSILKSSHLNPVMGGGTGSRNKPIVYVRAELN